MLDPAIIRGITKKGVKTDSALVTSQDLDYSPFQAQQVRFNHHHQLPPLCNPKSDHYSLKTLAGCLPGESVQQGGVQWHNALEDATSTIKLYKFDDLAFETNAHLWDVH